MRNKVYFASPWFNAEQWEREERLKAKLRELGFNVWSPKEMAICDSVSDNETRERIFRANCRNIKDSDIVFVVTDGKDMGTIWEAGYVCGYNAGVAEEGGYKSEPIKVVYYCETLGNGVFNLMLAQSGDIVITKFDDLDKLPNLIKLNRKIAYVGKIE